MRAVIPLLVLLFSMCGVQTRSTQTEVQTESQSTGAAAAAVSTQLDVSAELRELRDMVVELRVLLTMTQNELQNTKTQLYKMEDENDDLHTEMTVLKTRLAVSETEVVNLRKETAAQTERLAATETDMERVKKDTAVQQTGLTTVKTEVMDLIKENAAQETDLTEVKTRLAATETDVVNLEKEITDQPKVAFSAGLGSNIEAGSTEMVLVFPKIFTNVGQAYSSTTGFFTAPVRGVYYFRFTVLDLLYSRSMYIQLYKNGVQLISLHDNGDDGNWNYLSSGVTLQLEVGDVVNLQLLGNCRLIENSGNHNIFSGFLLFPL